jgi:hypothetical protein
MQSMLGVAEFGAAAFGSFAVALMAAKACLGGVLRVMAGRR